MLGFQLPSPWIRTPLSRPRGLISLYLSPSSRSRWLPSTRPPSCVGTPSSSSVGPSHRLSVSFTTSVPRTTTTHLHLFSSEKTCRWRVMQVLGMASMRDSSLDGEQEKEQEEEQKEQKMEMEEKEEEEEEEEEEEGQFVVLLSCEDYELSPEKYNQVFSDAQTLLTSVMKRVYGNENIDQDQDQDAPTPSAEWSLVLCSDTFIQTLNRSYLGKDCPTDVLSFPQQQDNIPLLGDVIISGEMAQKQAEERGYAWRDEVRVLMVHGLLHLLGYDHETGDEDLYEMADAERRIMQELGWEGQGLIEMGSLYNTILDSSHEGDK